MPENLFGAVFTAGGADISPAAFLMCFAAALLSGLVLTAAYRLRCACSRSFAVTLCMLPGVVCVIIIMVSGSIGAGVAVAGTFSLVRFRSAPGTAREILAVFMAMASGIISGMGFVAYALVYTVVISAVFAALEAAPFKEKREDPLRRTYRITVPEDLDYTGVFDDIFERASTGYSLVGVRTANLGTMYKLTYDVDLRPGTNEKRLIDDLRCRNGNLEISSSPRASAGAEL